MRHRLVESLLCASMLILNFRIVNRHQLCHHFVKGKVLILAKHHVPHFQHLLGFQSLLRFQSLIMF
ncbi:hypothetical protein MTR_0542s0010 [Medicago truncatula]|uniref:Uncharacterized protein n=1 Tax=Medicago truncatula TaxID=3880 RepID=A0A072TQG9_MEDTR|nr:hypothetical protein MTR_0542s0010 [Medicago truncatula]